MPNGQVSVVDIVNLMLHSLCVWSGTVIIIFSFLFVLFLLVPVLFACATILYYK